MLAANTMHKVADDIMANIDVPFLHIADTTAQAILAKGVHKVALLGTAFTMHEAFYKDRLATFDIECVLPTLSEQDAIHRIIYDELTLGVVSPTSRQRYLDIIASLQTQGVQGVILGCTEIGLPIHQDDVALPLFDTAILHAAAGAAFVLS